MSCDDLRNSLQDYVTRELAPERRRAVDEHLLECEACRRELALMSLITSSLDSQPVAEPSHRFSSDVLGRLPRRRVLAPSPWWVLVLAPVLGGLAYLFRVPLLGFLLEGAGRLGLDPGRVGPISLPDPGPLTIQQLGLFAAAFVVVTLGLTAGGAALGWKYFADRD